MILNGIKLSFIKYFDFKTRSSRSEYNYFLAFIFFAEIILTLIDETIGVIFSLAVLIPALSLSFRRLHDINKSGWWCIFPLLFMFVLGLVYFFIIMATGVGINLLTGTIFGLILLAPYVYYIYLTSIKAGDPEINDYG